VPAGVGFVQNHLTASGPWKFCCDLINPFFHSCWKIGSGICRSRLRFCSLQQSCSFLWLYTILWRRHRHSIIRCCQRCSLLRRTRFRLCSCIKRFSAWNLWLWWPYSFTAIWTSSRRSSAAVCFTQNSEGQEKQLFGLQQFFTINRVGMNFRPTF